MTHETPVLYSVDLGGCQSLCQLTADEIVETFTSALQLAGATVVQTSSHAFAGAGLTSVLILAESHAVIHTWPETGMVNIDIFSCSTRLKSLQAVDLLRRFLGARTMMVKETPRADGHLPGRAPYARA
jgi:S-adenosylmethionine decarboxylase